MTVEIAETGGDGVEWGMGETTIDYLGSENPETFRRRWNNKEFVGARIASRRKELGLTQTQVAEYFGVSREWVSLIESGRGECNAGDLAVWAKLLDTDPVFFLDRVYWQYPPSDPVITPEERENFGLILHYYSGLTSVLQGALVQAARGLYEAIRVGLRPSLSRQPGPGNAAYPRPRVVGQEVASNDNFEEVGSPPRVPPD